MIGLGLSHCCCFSSKSCKALSGILHFLHELLTAIKVIKLGSSPRLHFIEELQDPSGSCTFQCNDQCGVGDQLGSSPNCGISSKNCKAHSGILHFPMH